MYARDGKDDSWRFNTFYRKTGRKRGEMHPKDTKISIFRKKKQEKFGRLKKNP